MALTNDDGFERDRPDRLSPQDRIRLIAEFWNELRVCGDYGAADPVEVDQIERSVTEELKQRIPDIVRIESLTFKALHLMDGNI